MAARDGALEIILKNIFCLFCTIFALKARSEWLNLFRIEMGMQPCVNLCAKIDRIWYEKANLRELIFLEIGVPTFR